MTEEQKDEVHRLVQIVSVSNKLMTKNLVVSELLLIFAIVYRASHFRAGM